ncbi:hypothetical protein CKM354_000611100 [Cercospora kikuchii]|uniref:Amino acid transporter n=1 Tax=Cercospora kikuchii TaxID=84275 RepID=A0A9P3CLV0_9PEZI|nr:uncharacterized protein CKM354_000611100 [Cercospora kikuchii]GIZ42860.1 hypothetical protein CKM354_000611100 [Cercospora kikuchii]
MVDTEDDHDMDSTEERTSLLHEQPVTGAKISWTSAYVLIISRMIGSGIFAAPGVVAQSSGSIGEALLIWFLGVLLAACAAAVSMEYGCMLPQSGGQNLYLEYTYRKPKYLAMSVISVQVFLQTFTANNCIIFGQYLAKAMPFAVGAAWSKVSALTLLFFSAIMHGVFLRQGIKVQNMLGFLKIGMIVLIMCTALFVVVRGQPGPREPHGPQKSQDGVEPETLRSISRGLLRVFYAYAGIDNANMVLSEVRDPVAMLSRIIPLALATAFGIYLLVNMAFFVVVPWDVIQSSGELVATEFFARVLGPGWGSVICSLLIACCIAGNVMVGVFSLARQNQEIARRSYYPLLFASSQPFNAPLGGAIVNFIPTATIILAVPSSNIYSFLLDVEGYSAQIFASFVAGGNISFCKTIVGIFEVGGPVSTGWIGDLDVRNYLLGHMGKNTAVFPPTRPG